MAELLVRAKKHWMDDLTAEQVDKLPIDEKESYNARCQIGDIIVVKPDGWEWGREECLPTFLVIKLPGVNVSDVEHLTQPLNGDVEKDFSRRINKEEWDKEGAKSEIFLNKVLTTTPVAVSSDEKSYLVIGRWMQTIILKVRKYRMPEITAKSYTQIGSSVVDLSSSKNEFISSVLEKIA